MLIGALSIIAIAGVGTAVLGGVLGGVLLAGSVNFSAAIGRLAFESILQSDAPDANRGRAFAQFETQVPAGVGGRRRGARAAAAAGSRGLPRGRR